MSVKIIQAPTLKELDKISHKITDRYFAVRNRALAFQDKYKEFEALDLKTLKSRISELKDAADKVRNACCKVEAHCRRLDPMQIFNNCYRTESDALEWEWRMKRSERFREWATNHLVNTNRMEGRLIEKLALIKLSV